MSRSRSASEWIAGEVATWPGIEVDRGEIGELAFKLDRREIGHLHGDHAAHFSFPKSQWRELYAQGRIEHHPVFPDQVGPAARRILDDDDVRDVLALLRLNYDRVVARRGLPADAA
jgi:Luciferase